MRRYAEVSPYLLVGGAAAWFAKLTVIVATEGRVTDTGAAALFFLLGLALIVAGAPGIGVHLTAGRPAAVRVLAGAGSLVALVGISMIGGDLIAGSLAGVGPAYVADEVGIALAVVLAGAAGGVLLRSRDRSVPEPTLA